MKGKGGGREGKGGGREGYEGEESVVVVVVKR